MYEVPGPMSLYIHIPFCKKKCNYCDFVSYAGKEELIDDYVEALCKEINSPPCQRGFNPPPSLFKRGGKEGGEFSTIYFGGGTPTLLEPRHFEKILSSLVPRPSSIEISLEANPGTAEKAKLKALRELGINRLSIGIQSFNDKHLKTLGRIHNSADIFKFYENARSAGFDNINFDLIFALPNQTFNEWKTDLQTAISLGPNHLSTYNLQIEEGTPLWEMTKSEIRNLSQTVPVGTGRDPKQNPSPKFQIPNEEEELAMYEYTIEALTAKGYKHYEISNFAKPGYECLHNINYWKNGNYLGFGAGAHSHINGKRWANPNSIEEYLLRVAGHKSQVTSREPRTENDDLQRETIFMGLRLLEGLSTEKFIGFEKEVAELISDGLLERKNGRYKLTRQGLYLANLVFEKFI